MEKRSVRPEWAARARRLARWLFHAALPVYLLGLFLTLLKWNDPAPMGTYWAKVLMHGGRIVMTAAFAEKFLRPGKQAWVMAAVLAAGFVSAQISQPWYLYDLALLTFLSDLAEEKTTGKILLWAHGVMALAALWLRETGIVTEQLENGRFAVETYGMTNVNAVGAFLLSVTLTAWLVWLRKKPLAGGALCWGMAAVTMLATHCVTATVLLAVFPVLYAGLEALRKRGRSLIWTAAVPGAACILSLAVTGIIAGWDSASGLSGPLGTVMQRFADAAEALRRVGFTFFGRPMPEGRLTDNLYLYTLLVFGIGGLLMLLCGMTWALREAARRERSAIVALELLFALYGIMESTPVLMAVYHFTPVLLLAGDGKRREAPLPEITVRTKTVCSLCAALVCAVLAFALPAGEGYGTARRVVRLGIQPVGAPLTGEARFRQTFVSEEKEMRGIELLTAVKGERPEGTLVLTLEAEDGTVLEERRTDASRIGDNRYWITLFDRAWPPGNYAVSVRTENWQRGGVALHQSEKNRYKPGDLYEDGKKTKLDWAFGLVFRTVSGRRAVALAMAAAALAIISLVWAWPGRKGARRAGKTGGAG